MFRHKCQEIRQPSHSKPPLVTIRVPFTREFMVVRIPDPPLYRKVPNEYALMSAKLEK